jgi:hypothetical protein
MGTNPLEPTKIQGQGNGIPAADVFILFSYQPEETIITSPAHPLIFFQKFMPSSGVRRFKGFLGAVETILYRVLHALEIWLKFPPVQLSRVMRGEFHNILRVIPDPFDIDDDAHQNQT